VTASGLLGSALLPLASPHTASAQTTPPRHAHTLFFCETDGGDSLGEDWLQEHELPAKEQEEEHELARGPSELPLRAALDQSIFILQCLDLREYRFALLKLLAERANLRTQEHTRSIHAFEMDAPSRLRELMDRICSLDFPGKALICALVRVPGFCPAACTRLYREGLLSAYESPQSVCVSSARASTVPAEVETRPREGETASIHLAQSSLTLPTLRLAASCLPTLTPIQRLSVDWAAHGEAGEHITGEHITLRPTLCVTSEQNQSLCHYLLSAAASIPQTGTQTLTAGASGGMIARPCGVFMRGAARAAMGDVLIATPLDSLSLKKLKAVIEREVSHFVWLGPHRVVVQWQQRTFDVKLCSPDLLHASLVLLSATRGFLQAIAGAFVSHSDFTDLLLTRGREAGSIDDVFVRCGLESPGPPCAWW
jgi:hypothetical protein